MCKFLFTDELSSHSFYPCPLCSLRHGLISSTNPLNFFLFTIFKRLYKFASPILGGCPKYRSLLYQHPWGFHLTQCTYTSTSSAQSLSFVCLIPISCFRSAYIFTTINNPGKHPVASYCGLQGSLPSALVVTHPENMLMTCWQDLAIIPLLWLSWCEACC